MESGFKTVMKIFLLLVGSVMLIGGGICTVTDVFFAVTSGFRSGSGFILLLALISALIAWAGWWAIKFSGFGQTKRSPMETKPEVNEEAEK